MQKSSGKLLYSQAREDFVDLLFSFFNIPIGGGEEPNTSGTERLVLRLSTTCIGAQLNS